jgi:putative ABC transport system permease protein
VRRSTGVEPHMTAFVADLRYAVRRLRRSPGFTLVAVLTLALGIGATAAIFSAVNPILFQPLPYPNADRILKVSDLSTDGSPFDLTFGTFREIVLRSSAFETQAVLKPWQPAMTGAEEPERLVGQRVSAGYFRALGLAPSIGRDFAESDDAVHGPQVAIISDGLLQRRFGGDRSIVGKQVTLDGEPFTVIGVMPRGFDNVLSPAAEVWTPLQYDASLPSLNGREWGHHLRMIARVKTGVAMERARRDLDAIARRPVPEFVRPPWASMKQGLLVRSLQDDATRGIKPALLAILGAVLLVLTIACVNVTNLLLGRARQRRGEFAMRAALGAGRGRLIRQLLTESLVLAAAGGAVGLVVAQAGVRALVLLSPPGLPRLTAIHLDGSVFAFALAVTTIVGVVVGLAPALDAARGDLHGGVQGASRRTAGDHRLMRGALVAVEVSLAMVLLVGAGLLLRSIERVIAVAPGFQSAHLVTLQVEAVGQPYGRDSARYRLLTQSLDAVRALPGVTAVTSTSQLPLSGDFDKYGVEFESAPVQNAAADQSALRYAVMPGYFEAMAIPLRRGRLLDLHDAAGAPVAIVINESFARARFGGRDPIGQRVRIGPAAGRADAPWSVIVGVVGDVKQTALDLDAQQAFYVTTAQWAWVDNEQSIVVRARGDAAALVPAIKKAIWSVDKDQPITRVATISGLVAAASTQRRFALIVFEAFGLVALVLAANGIYGVLAASVGERTREIGVRAALGASRGAILSLIMREGMTMAGIGVVLGLAGAVASSRALRSMLFGVTNLDAITYVVVVILLAGVAAAACLIPAWRAARVDPATTLRAE